MCELGLKEVFGNDPRYKVSFYKITKVTNKCEYLNNVVLWVIVALRRLLEILGFVDNNFYVLLNTAFK